MLCNKGCQAFAASSRYRRRCDDGHGAPGESANAKSFGSVSTVEAVADALHIVVDALQITLDGL